MSRNIIVLITIVAIGLGLYFFTPFFKGGSQTALPAKAVSVAPPVERHEFQGMKYEIISVGGPIYDIITGQLSEDQVKILADKIIGDVIAENQGFEEVTLLFYSDLIAVGVGDVDVSRTVWTKEGSTVTMSEK